VLDDEAIPERLMARYPPAEITAAQFEQFAVELLTVGQSGHPELEDFRVQTLERIEGVDGSYICDATVRFRLFGMDFLIVVEARNHTHPIKRELVQILHSKAVSVGAQKAVLVATAQLQQGAINYAKTHGIALVLVTEGRFTFETKGAGEWPTLSRQHADALGIPPLVACFGPTDTEAESGSRASLRTGPISFARPCSASTTTAVSRPRTGQASERPELVAEQRRRDERTSQRAESEQGASERFCHRTPPISHECIGDQALVSDHRRGRVLVAQGDSACRGLSAAA